MELTACQKNALVKLKQWWLESNDQYFVLAGYAGTGKSSIIEVLISEIQGTSRRNNESYIDLEYAREIANISKSFNVAYMAPTGKASLVLNNKGMDATTIHSFMYRPEKYKDEKGKNRVKFVLKKKADFASVDLIVVDEASMVNEGIFNDLLSLNKPIIFIGDHGQLEPVVGKDDETGKNRKEFFSIMSRPDVFMNTITRTAEDNPILHLATMARTGKYIEYGLYSKGVGVYPASDFKVSGLAKADQLICGFNRTRNTLNRMVRRSIGMTTKFPDKGDKLICLKNDYTTGLINGLIGHCKKRIPDDQRTVGHLEFKSECGNVGFNGSISMRHLNPEMFKQMAADGTLEDFSEENLQQFDYGYAITAHKCVTGDTLVMTNKGYKQIKDVVGLETEGSIDAPKDLLVHNGEYLEPVKKLINAGKSKTITITTNFGYELEVTPDHRCVVLENGEKVIKSAMDLKITDNILLATNMNSFNDEVIEFPESYYTDTDYKLPKIMTVEFAEFLGALTLTKNRINKDSMIINNGNLELLKSIKNKINVIFGIKANISKMKNSHIHSKYYIKFTSEIVNFISNFNISKVNQYILSSSKEIQLSYLKYVFMYSYTSLEKNKKVSYIKFSTANKDFYTDLKLMLLNFGIVTSSYNKDSIYKLYINGKNVRIFKNLINNTNFHHKSIDNYKIDTITNLTHSDIEVDTYCFEMEKTGTFVQNGQLQGNCQGSEYNYPIIMNEPFGGYGTDTYNRWLYTAITRAKQKLYILRGGPKMLKDAKEFMDML